MPVRKSQIWKPQEHDELLELLGSEGDWSFWGRSRPAVNGWHNFALQPPEKMRRTKSVFHGAWNGERLCGNRDLGMLAEHHPEIYVELEKCCPSIEWETSP